MQNSCPRNGVAVLTMDRRASYRRPETDLQRLTAAELVRLCLAPGDDLAWCEFLRRFQPLIACVIARTIRRWGYPQPGLVDDLVQETYLRLCAGNFKALREFEFKHDSALFGFLKVVASNVVQDHFRHSNCRKRGSGKIEDDLEPLALRIASDEDCVERVQRAILMNNIRECLRKQSLEPCFTRDYSIFWLYFEKGFTAKAISRLPGLGLTEKGVESALLRMTRFLRTKLGQTSPMA